MTAASILPGSIRRLAGRLAVMPHRLATGPYMRPDESSPHDVGLLIIYRQRNAGMVLEVLRTARRHDWHVRLWALDAVDASLAEHTVGVGPGLRLPLLNRLQASLPTSTASCVVADDDVVFVAGGLDQLVSVAMRGGFGLAQPAHVVDSHRSHGITRYRPLAVARRTTFVEVGPVVFVGPACRDRVFPLPEEYEMGWGLDVVWSLELGSSGQLGIIDTVLIEHTAPVASDYSGTEAWRRVDTLLSSHGIPAIVDLQTTTDTWWSGRRRPPW